MDTSATEGLLWPRSCHFFSRHRFCLFIDNNSVQFIPHVKERGRRGASPQDVLADEAAVVAVGAGDEQQHLAGVLHAAQPRLDVVGAGLQVAARVPLHAGEVGAGVL